MLTACRWRAIASCCRLPGAGQAGRRARGASNVSQPRPGVSAAAAAAAAAAADAISDGQQRQQPQATPAATIRTCQSG